VRRRAGLAAIAASAIVLAVVGAPRRAHAEPSDRTLVYVGLAMAPPTYVVGVTLHESSHALAAKLLGAEVDELHVFPPGHDPHSGVFRFGWTYVHGLRTRGDKVVFYIAPKITDAALLGGFAALVLTGAWPHNRYGQLALTVGATGLWVDFSKDVLAFSPNNDVVKIWNLWCMTGWRQVPARLVYGGIAVGLGLLVARGYQRTFSDPAPSGTTTQPVMMPIVGMTF
jgi:hypothetical protein